MTSTPTPGTPSAPARGLDGVVAVQTRLSHVDGQSGVLIIGGYELQELAGKVAFEEAAHLLCTGRLPTPAEAEVFSREIAALRAIPDGAMAVVVEAAKRGAPPIDALRMGCSMLSLDGGRPNEISSEADLANAKMLLARLPTIAAAYARAAGGREVVAPRADLSLAANFLYMVSGEEPDPLAARALDTYWVTVIDHGMNASTFTARVIASTRSDMVSAVTGAIGALKGPLHGGAPAEVVSQLHEIGSPDHAEAWINAALDRGERLMGFGHRVYRAYDPRAAALRKVAEGMSGTADWLRLAVQVEDVALRILAERHPDRPLKTNVEYYTAAVLQGVGLPPDLYPATFALARHAGWTAHCIEQAGVDRLIRPDVRYVGEPERDLPAG